jgi:hypothetical protein
MDSVHVGALNELDKSAKIAANLSPQMGVLSSVAAIAFSDR